MPVLAPAPMLRQILKSAWHTHKSAPRKPHLHLHLHLHLQLQPGAPVPTRAGSSEMPYEPPRGHSMGRQVQLPSLRALLQLPPPLLHSSCKSPPTTGQRCFVHRLVNGSLVWLAVRLAGFVVNQPMPTTTGSNRAVPAVTGPTMAEAVPSRGCRAQPLKSLSVGTLHSDSTMYQQPKAPYVLCFKPVIR